MIFIFLYLLVGFILAYGFDSKAEQNKLLIILFWPLIIITFIILTIQINKDKK